MVSDSVRTVVGKKANGTVICFAAAFAAITCCAATLRASEDLQRIARCTTSENVTLVERACLALAMRRAEPERVVSAVFSTHRSLVPIKVLGHGSLPFVYPHLMNASHRTAAVMSIALVSRSGPGKDVPWKTLEAAAASDDDLRQVLALLRAAALPSEDAERRLKELEPIPRRLLRSCPGFLYAAVTFDTTRAWGLRVSRSNLLRGLKELDRKEGDHELTACVCAIALASASGALAPDDLDLMRRARHPALGTPTDLVVLWTDWRATRTPGFKFDVALRESGEDSLDYENQLLYGTLDFVSVNMLSDADIPMLLTRAADERADEKIRAGAVPELSQISSRSSGEI
jgi:hypothetical protein